MKSRKSNLPWNPTEKLDLQFHHITVTVCNCNIELGTIYIPKKISTYMSVHIYEIRYLN